MKWYWKALIGITSLALLATILNIGLNRWIKSELPKIINRENNYAYKIKYENLTISLWNSKIFIREIIIVPKAAVVDTINKSGVYAEIHSIEINHFNIWNILLSNKINAKSITIEQPKLILYNRKENIRQSVTASFDKIISVSDIYVRHGDLKIIYNKNNKGILRIHNINLHLHGVMVTSKILKNKIPFEFKNYTLTCDSLNYHSNQFYHIRTNKIKVSKTDLIIDQFKMIPKHTRREFVAKIPKEKDQYTLFCQSVRASKMDWGFKGEDLFVHCNIVALNQASANIYRSKLPADNLKKKHLYNKLLRDLKFDLKVDTLKVRNSIVEYEEEKSFKLGAGKLSFSRFNLTATSICSGFKKEKLPDLKIKINCRFMKTSPLNVNWKLNVMDKSDGFQISGTLTNFNTERISPFSKPYLNVRTSGIIDLVHFNFIGNDKRASGKFAIKYDNLKFTIYKKDDRKIKNKLLTLAAKIFVKRDTKDKVKQTHIEVERIPEKSFYNLLWRCIAEGLKKTLV